MREESLAFLRRLIEAPSPSGYERPAQQVVREYAGGFADEVRTDVHGNVIAALNPTGSPRIMFAGHCDQIGPMVQHIDDDGYLFTNAIGGFDCTVLVGQNVTVWAKSGPLPGVMARKPIHLMRDEEDKKPPKLTDLWVDIGARSRDEALELVRVGDPITWNLDLRLLRNDLAVAPGFDDKCGTFAVIEALRLLAGKDFPAAVFAVSTVQEEVGLRGAVTSTFSVAPDVGIAVDVTFATDQPTLEKKISGAVARHTGPAIPRGPNTTRGVDAHAVSAAAAGQIPYQLCGSSRPTGTDANVMQISRAGVATGLVSVPNRYMHSPVEMISLQDLQQVAQLLAEFALGVPAGTDFTP